MLVAGCLQDWMFLARLANCDCLPRIFAGRADLRGFCYGREQEQKILDQLLRSRLEAATGPRDPSVSALSAFRLFDDRPPSESIDPATTLPASGIQHPASSIQHLAKTLPVLPDHHHRRGVELAVA